VATLKGMSLDSALDLARARRDRALSELLEELRIPSVSALPEHLDDCRRNADWLAQRFRDAGFETQLVDVLEGGKPVLRADWRGAGEAPTLTIYGHYDVQPPDPLEEWETPPFEPAVRNGSVFARGAADNKGNHMAALQAAACAIQAGVPINLRFLLEGEEESGGDSLARYLRANAAELVTDHVLIWDGGFGSDGRPALVTGLRGLLYVELEAKGPARDLHSGSFGGNAPNPINTLARILGELKDRRGHVTIPGFYDEVRPPSPDEMADWDLSPAYGERIRELIGASALEGEPEYSPAERGGSRPTLDVNGIIGGFTGEGSKTVIPARCRAKVSMRLVPDQDPDRILESLRRYVAELTTPGVGVEVRRLGSAPPVLVGADHAGTRALAAAYEAAFGKRPARVRMGGSIPVAIDFKEALAAPMIVSGLSQPGSGQHGPNEHLSLEHYYRGTEALLRLMWALV
jgi:acetylornithine deacetylase/succinyl-diaminopimelate desuccinylase-like protein